MIHHEKRKVSGRGERLEDRIAPAVLGGGTASALADSVPLPTELEEPVQEIVLVDIDETGTGLAGTEYTVQSDVVAEVGLTTVTIEGDSSLTIGLGEESITFTSSTDASMFTDPFTGETLITSDTTLAGSAGQEITIHGEGIALDGEEEDVLSGSVTITGPNGGSVAVDGSITVTSSDSGTTVTTAADVTTSGGGNATVAGSTTVNTSGGVESHSTTVTNAEGQSFTFGRPR
ncbi:MAG: hypothetical protein HQM03_09090 [Magnetococcales bacterium]|nr:hypothetical protein [Magnetococcales bacterium]